MLTGGDIKMKDKKVQEGNRLKVITFGNFNIIGNEGSLTDKHSGSLKLWELFKFLITYRDELILPEKIIDSIWPESDYQDPNRTLRALMFRLRKILSEHSGSSGKDIIVHCQGCYKLDSSKLYDIDAIAFEDLFNEANSIAEENPAEAIDLYYRVIEMYKNGYLRESYDYEWLIPARNCYRRIFLRSITEVSELLKEKNQYQQVIAICENALRYELLEEEIHFQYIEALAEMGKINQAKNHYDYVVEIFERELGIKPSQKLNKLYRLICGSFNEINIDTTSILEKLIEETNPTGAILCGPEFFKLQYQLEKRRYEREGKSIFVGLLTISSPDYTVPSGEQLKCVMDELRKILIITLRKGDVITQWNKAQFIINLPGLEAGQAKIALERIRKKFVALDDNKDMILHMKIEQVEPNTNTNRNTNINTRRASS